VGSTALSGVTEVDGAGQIVALVAVTDRGGVPTAR